MRVLILAAGSQRRWRESGGQGLKQFIEIDGETVIRRAFRLASEHCEDVVTVVSDPEHPRWRGLNPAAAERSAAMGEMGKFLDHRHLWGEQSIALLFGDAYYTEAAIDLILGADPAEPMVYGRAARYRPKRVMEIFGVCWAHEHNADVIRTAEECCDAGLASERGGAFRWFYRRRTGGADYTGDIARELAADGQGWIEVPPDATDDFDSLPDLRTWRRRFGRRPIPRNGATMRIAEQDLFAYDGPVRRLIVRAGRPIPDRLVHLVEDAAPPEPPASSVPAPVAYSKLKQPELKALLDERGIEYPSGPVRNADLVALLEAADEG